jgi:hypothetical protein
LDANGIVWSLVVACHIILFDSTKIKRETGIFEFMLAEFFNTDAV